jgi:hypothetical protein
MAKDIVDLHMSEDGTYIPGKKSKEKDIAKIKDRIEHKAKRGTGTAPADEFLAGVDVGLDLVDAIKIRALRIMGMRD